ncbi:MAG TPA: two-component regulator propeller domain-containing protein [Steroidobacteraceae bacterium]|nr:two-component regulator propeller domain-containing protein [Steroidobacteraceae bacterium]
MKGRINSIVQTSDGYLWLGTEFGLVRFDGIRFVPSGPGIGPPLPSSNILSLLAGRDGALWVGTLKGLVNWHQGQLVQYPALAATPVFSLLEDHEGTVWAGGAAGLCAIRGTKVQCSEIEGRPGRGLFYSNEPRGSAVYSLYEDSDRHLWVGTESGLWQWTPGPPHRYASQTFRAPQALVSGDRGTGLVAISGADDRILLKTAGNGMEEYTIPGVPQLFGAESLLRDRHGALWIGTMQRGLLHVQEGRVTWLEERSRLSGDFVDALLEDREGTIWVGTTNGLDHLREAAVSTISAQEGLSTPVACVLAARDGSLWMGSYGGLNRWSRGQRTIYRSNAPPVTRPVLALAPQTESGPREITQIVDSELPGSAIDSLFEDGRGRIWVGTDRGTAWFENGRFHRVVGVPDTIWIAMFADAREGVWISYPGSGLFHVVDGSVVDSVLWPWSAHGPDPRLSAVVPDSRTGGLWLAFLHGGVAYFKDRQVRGSFRSKDGLGSDTVWNLHLDHEGTLWAATEGGLSRIRDGRVKTLTTRNGMPCDSIKWVIEDDAFSLWLNTACGLLRIERSELDAWASGSQHPVHPLVFDRTDGLRMHALGAALNPVVTKSPDGKLWFAHLDGVSAIDPLHLPTNRVPPPVHIELITADGQTYAPVPGLRLPAQLHDLTIDYTALSLVAPEKVRFRFKLEGQDREWREVLNIRRVQYSNLAPGSYDFRVIAANNSGVWNQEGAVLDFSIAPAFWQTDWFRALCGAAFVGLLWTLYRLRLRHVAREFELGLDARVAERTRIARELHDTLLQSFHGLLLRFQTVWDLLPTRPAEARDILARSIDQANKAITQGREAVEGLRTSTQESNDLVVAIRTLGEEFAAGEANALPVAFRVDVEGAPRPMHPIVRDEIYRIAGEALRNAFHHSRGTQIEVALHYDERELRLRVRDNGRGIDAKALAEGGRPGHYGLRGMHERAELIGGKLTVWSALDSGTEVEFSVPASRAYAQARGAMRALSD